MGDGPAGCVGARCASDRSGALGVLAATTAAGWSCKMTCCAVVGSSQRCACQQWWLATVPAASWAAHCGTKRSVEALSRELGGGVAVTTNGLDCVAALKASGVNRPFLVLPPWFNDDTVAAGVRYWRARGTEPAGHLRYDPGRKWRDVLPSELYRQGMGFEQEIEPLYQQVRAACPQEADGVLIAGTGFRCVGILDALEQDLRRPVVSANQASLWHCLRLSGVRTPVSGYGNLLRL